MSCCLWSTSAPTPLINRFEHHSEFAVGLDFNLFIPGQISTGSWDGHCAVWNIQGQPPPKLQKTIRPQQMGGTQRPPPILSGGGGGGGGNIGGGNIGGGMR